MINEYITSNHLPLIAETIKTYVDYKINESDSKHYKEHANLINVTYNELYYMKRTSRLIPGQYYRITDYVTTTNQSYTISDGKVRPIIVLAIDNYTLSEEAMTDDGCKIWYCIDNDTDRFIWAGATKSVLSFDYNIENDANVNSGQFNRNESLVIEESDITYYGYTFVGGTSNNIFSENDVLWYTEEFPEFTDNYVSHTFYQISDENMIPINMDSKFYEKEEPIGKGVIYRMIDKNGNDLPYDFKSIMFKNPNDETDDKYYYTFYHESSNNEIIDATTDNSMSKICYNNIIKYYKMNDKMYIPKNIFRINPGRGCYNNSFGDNCDSNTFGNNCHNNTFGDSCYNNTFGDSCFNNTFGDSCYNSSFGNNCYVNTFGYRCYKNSFGDSCYNNIFGRGCYNNTFGNNYYDNTFGCGCYNNIFIYVNNNDSSQTGNLNGIVNCYFSNEYQYNELKHLKTSNTNSSAYLKNVHFCKGLKGSKAGSKITYNTITIEGTLSDKTETKVAINSKGELKIYCEADLIA